MFYAALFWLWTRLLDVMLPIGRIVYWLFVSLPVQLYLKLKFGKSSARVVIVGGGFGGTGVAKELQNLVHVDLIDNKEFFEFTPSVLRAVVDPRKLKNIQIPHATYLSSCNIHTGTATRIDTENNKIIYRSENNQKEESLPFDYVVLASGSGYLDSFKNPYVIVSTRARDLVSHQLSIMNEKKIVIIGGGYVGVELAAEIIVEYPQKEVVLIHSGSRLLSRCPEKAGNYALRFFKKHGVRVLLNERLCLDSLDQIGSGQFAVNIKTESGLEIGANIAFVCIGTKPVSSFINEDGLDAGGFVRVNSYLQTSLGMNIFSCGDVTDIQEEKLAQSSQKASWIVVMNVLKAIRSSSLTTYNSRTLPIVISLGKFDAVFTFGNLVLCGFIPALIKEVVEWKVLISY